MRLKVSLYPSYQATQFPSVPSVPAHWEVRPGLAALKERRIKNTRMQENTVLSLSYGRIVIKPEEKLHGLVPASFEGYQIIEPGNLIIRPTDLQNDQVSLRVGRSEHRGIITSAYIGLETCKGVSSEYAFLLLHTYDLKKIFYSLGSGLRQNLSWSDFRRLPFPVPSPEEQDAIVRFIRYIDQRVNRLLKNKRRLIELLNEQKQAIIHRAVTRGLDPAVPLKPSGVEWLGDVPEHWAVRKIAHTFDIIGSGTTPASGDRSYYDGGNIPWVVTGDLKNKELTSTNKHVTNKALSDYSTLKMFPANSVIVALYGATIGKVGLLRFPACVNQACCVLANSKFLLPEYTTQLFVAFREEIVRLGVGGGQPNISQDIIRHIRLPVPPQAEQNSILVDLAKETQPLDTAIFKANAEIDFIREYRTRLVSDVVTGQLDVRGLVLPEMDEEAVAVGGADEELDELDEDTEGAEL